MFNAVHESMPTPTLATLLEWLGDVPASRIIFDPLPTTATEKDCIRLEQSELIEGTLVEIASKTFEEAVLCTWIGSKIGLHAEEADLGVTTNSRLPLTLWPGRIRRPDIAYFPWQSIRGSENFEAPEIVPALVVEIKREANTEREIDLMRSNFFAKGTEQFWVVDQIKRSVVVHSSDLMKVVVPATGTLTGGKILPGFALNIKDIFDYLDKIVEKLNG